MITHQARGSIRRGEEEKEELGSAVNRIAKARRVYHGHGNLEPIFIQFYYVAISSSSRRITWV